MGKTTGFKEVRAGSGALPGRGGAAARLRRDLHPARRRAVGDPGRPLHGLRRSVLPGRRRLPHRQPDPGVERPRLPGPLARGTRPPAQDQQLPRVHRAGVPGALRRILRARHHGPAGHHQEHRDGHHRPRLRRRVGDGESARGEDGPARRRGGVGTGGPRRGGAAQLRGPSGHRLRAGGPGGRAADVRHPQHEARQAHGAAPRRSAARGGRRLRHRRRGRGPATVPRTSGGCARRAMPCCSPPARPCRGICPSRAAACPACTSPWST